MLVKDLLICVIKYPLRLSGRFIPTLSKTERRGYSEGGKGAGEAGD